MFLPNFSWLLAYTIGQSNVIYTNRTSTNPSIVTFEFNLHVAERGSNELLRVANRSDFLVGSDVQEYVFVNTDC